MESPFKYTSFNNNHTSILFAKYEIVYVYNEAFYLENALRANRMSHVTDEHNLDLVVESFLIISEHKQTDPV